MRQSSAYYIHPIRVYTYIQSHTEKSRVDILPTIKYMYVYWKPNHASFKSSSTELPHLTI